MNNDAIRNDDQIAERGSRIAESTERSWGYRLIRGTYQLEKENQSLLTSAATDGLMKELKKDFEEYG